MTNLVISLVGGSGYFYFRQKTISYIGCIIAAFFGNLLSFFVGMLLTRYFPLFSFNYRSSIYSPYPLSFLIAPTVALCFFAMLPTLKPRPGFDSPLEPDKSPS